MIYSRNGIPGDTTLNQAEPLLEFQRQHPDANLAFESLLEGLASVEAIDPSIDSLDVLDPSIEAALNEDFISAFL